MARTGKVDFAGFQLKLLIVKNPWLRVLDCIHAPRQWPFQLRKNLPVRTTDKLLESQPRLVGIGFVGTEHIELAIMHEDRIRHGIK